MKILLAIDESKFSEAATKAVCAQANPKDSEVSVLNVIEVLSPQLPEMRTYYPGIEHDRDAQRKPAQELVEKAAKLLRSSGVQVTTAVKLGNPKSTIIDVARKWHADLIVMGSHGRTGLERFLLGSASDAVFRHAHCSVELVRIPPAIKGSNRVGKSGDGKTKRILLATDGSKFSEAATRLLIEQARPQDTEVQVLHVVEPPSLLVVREMGGYDPGIEVAWETQTKVAEVLVKMVGDQLRAKGFKVTTAVDQGDARSKIIDAASKWHADLIILGSHGRKGLENFLVGSISEGVARHAKCSVEIVRIPRRK